MKQNVDNQENWRQRRQEALTEREHTAGALLRSMGFHRLHFGSRLRRVVVNEETRLFSKSGLLVFGKSGTF